MKSMARISPIALLTLIFALQSAADEDKIIFIKDVRIFDGREVDLDTAIYVGAAGGQIAENMLMRGFTSVRDAGGASIAIQRAIDDGWFNGLRVFSSGAFITQTSGHLDMRDRTNPHHHVGGAHSHAQRIGHYVAVDGASEMLGAARQNFRAAATQLKLATNGGISAIYSC